MMNRLLKIVLIFSLLLLTSCKGIAFENKKTAKAEEFTKGEVMVFVAEEKNKYESRFGHDMWTLKSGSGDAYFKDYVVNNVKLFIEKLMKLKLVSEDLNIIISNSDELKLKDAKDEYISMLSNGDIEYLECTYDDLYNAFRDYHLARLVIDNLSKNATDELSISEAKVIKLQYIVMEDKKVAEETRELLNAKGASFAYYARTRSKETEVEMIIKRGDEMSTRFPEVFYLSNGQISDILQSLNKYYIFKCVNDYMVEETEDRRLEILKAMKNDEFNINYAKYDEMYELKSNSTYWRDIDLSYGKDCTIYKFDEIYYKYFPRNIK